MLKLPRGEPGSQDNHPYEGSNERANSGLLHGDGYGHGEGSSLHVADELANEIEFDLFRGKQDFIE